MSENTSSEHSTPEHDASEHGAADGTPRAGRGWKRRRPPFDPGAVTRAASDTLTVRRVFGEAYERGDTLVIPVAKMMGGTGSGFGVGTVGGAGVPTGRPGGSGDDGEHDHGHGHGPDHGPHGEGEGSGGGGGFGVRVRPVGVYVIDDSGVHWRPALDLNRVILGGQAVGVAVSLALAWALRRRRD